MIANWEARTRARDAGRPRPCNRMSAEDCWRAMELQWARVAEQQASAPAPKVTVVEESMEPR